MDGPSSVGANTLLTLSEDLLPASSGWWLGEQTLLRLSSWIKKNATDIYLLYILFGSHRRSCCDSMLYNPGPLVSTPKPTME